jgi:acyl carrier protein
MTDKPSFEEFNEGMIRAVESVMGGDEKFDVSTLDRMREEKANFDYSDNGIDSLDLLDIAFSADKSMGIRIGIEESVVAVNEGREPALTTGVLFKHIRED